jgi:hypothetical protein
MVRRHDIRVIVPVSPSAPIQAEYVSLGFNACGFRGKSPANPE